MYIGNYIFQQSAACKIKKFSDVRLNHSGSSGEAKATKFLSYGFSRYNFEKLIQTLCYNWYQSINAL